MRWESENYLKHYGINGQKWGIRRYQNEDGSYTSEGKRRHSEAEDKKFLSVKNEIKKRLSNTPGKFQRKPMDKEIVKRRGDLTDREADECCQLAEDLYKRSASIEPAITKDVISSVSSSGANMFGLENRLKQPTSLASKIGADAKESNTSFDKASRAIKDAIRYTSVSDDSDFVDNYFRTKSELEEKGYTELRCKNNWSLYSQKKVSHKSVQCVYADKKGNPFEIQFQTAASQAAKELKTPLYERRRSSGLSSRQKIQLERQMQDLAERVPFPKNVLTIKSHP